MTRQDGRVLRIPDNAWTTLWIEKEQGQDPVAIRQLHIVDFGGPGVYTLDFGAGADGILHVPAEYPTIQAAIDAAESGHTVLVADGRYTREGNNNLDFGGKAITVRSTSGNPNACIIDCEGSGSGVLFHGGEGPDSVLEGLSIVSSGYMTRGGGIACMGSNPSIIHCVIADCSASEGGGVYCRDAGPTIADSVISGCYAELYGGGVACEPGGTSNVTLIRCTISGNSVSYEGGGVHCYGSDNHVTLLNCSITDNIFRDNTGGGIACRGGGRVTMANCVVAGNSTPFDFGGACAIYGLGAGSVISNCLIHDNAGPYGVARGIETVGAGTLFVDCTIANNGSLRSCNAQFVNCIIWGNGDPQFVWSTPAVRYSAVEGGWAGDGNISTNPQFVDPDGPDDYQWTWADNDYRLAVTSPCIDAGDNSAVPSDDFDLDGDGDLGEPLPYDLIGNPRFTDVEEVPDTGAGTPPIVDMGAYEHSVPGTAGDLNGDGDVDAVDFMLFTTCLAGPDIPTPPPGCDPAVFEAADFDADNDVDIRDFALLQVSFGG